MCWLSLDITTFYTEESTLEVTGESISICNVIPNLIMEKFIETLYLFFEFSNIWMLFYAAFLEDPATSLSGEYKTGTGRLILFFLLLCYHYFFTVHNGGGSAARDLLWELMHTTLPVPLSPATIPPVISILRHPHSSTNVPKSCTAPPTIPVLDSPHSSASAFQFCPAVPLLFKPWDLQRPLPMSLNLTHSCSCYSL